MAAEGTRMFDSDLTKEEEDKMIDSIGVKVIENELETTAIFLLELARPIFFIASQFAAIGLTMFGWILGTNAQKYVALFMKRDNVDRIIRRIEDLRANDA